MTTDTQKQPNNDDYVVNPTVVLRETTNSLKGLLEASTNLPAELRQSALSEIESIEANYLALVDDDFKFAHDNMRDLIKRSMDALSTVFVIAGASDNPRAFEVAALYVKTLSEINRDLITLHSEHSKAKNTRAATKPKEPQNLTQNLFVGSPSDLLSLMLEKKEKVING